MVTMGEVVVPGGVGVSLLAAMQGQGQWVPRNPLRSSTGLFLGAYTPGSNRGKVVGIGSDICRGEVA